MLRFPSILIATGLIMVYQVHGDCPDGFLRHQNACYHFSHDTEEWFVAAGMCKSIYGGMLVEINDDNENNFLGGEATIRKTQYWIGANDLQVEGEWKWLTSGDPVTSPKWGGPPSNSNNDENCAEIIGVVWNDNSCHKSQHYICEVDMSSTEIVG